jgi:hypothetical protein
MPGFYTPSRKVPVVSEEPQILKSDSFPAPNFLDDLKIELAKDDEQSIAGLEIRPDLDLSRVSIHSNGLEFQEEGEEFDRLVFTGGFNDSVFESLIGQLEVSPR